MTQERTQCQALAEVMHEVNNLLRAAGAADIMHYLQTNDISVPRYMVLRMLSDTEGVTISHVATQLHLTLGSTSQLIDRLEQDGLVSRHDDEDDRIIYSSKVEKSLMRCVQLPSIRYRPNSVIYPHQQ